MSHSPQDPHPEPGRPTPEPQRDPVPGPPPRRPAGTIRLGSIAGADVLVTSSWFIVAALVSWIVSPRIEQVQPGIGAWKYVAGFAFAVILYLAILLHEASHALMARRFGARVTSITLHFLGGATAVEGEARTPKQEFWVAVVGPITSLAIGALGVGLWFLTPEGVLRVGVEGLAGANLLIGVLNLLPALPLDGGRVLKAGVWKLTGNPHRGSLVAGWCGRVLAVLMLAYPFLLGAVLDITPGVIDFVLAAVVAIFLLGGANAVVARARMMEKLPALVVRDLARRTCLVDSQMPLNLAVARAQAEQAGGIVTVDEQRRPVGIVSEAALLAVPEHRRAWMSVSEVARSVGPGAVLPVTLVGEDLVRAIGRSPLSEYLVVDATGAVHGVLSTADVDRAFRGTPA
ncbi:site-2 protease family protein [Nocardioides yefusunii]|uniref:Zinc metalloprotease n=1 Tax=Nocardioides yefusunii TaxID=2500546 RepID=A0ABW1QX72_9ACTN|nr:site-2 protease family protein [Nocardioides yefusunii]